MDRPRNLDLPFFAYGLFKPGQLAYFQLRDFISGMPDIGKAKGDLLLRDGLPILDPDGNNEIPGVLLNFQEYGAGLAYDRISAMEPDKQYRWAELKIGDQLANTLVGRSPQKGSVPCEDFNWNGWDDPLFNDALKVVDETLDKQEFDWNDLRPMFRLQMAYLLLWSAIERYLSLRYQLGKKVTEKIEHLAVEPAFADALRKFSRERREVFRADDPGKKEVLDPQAPKRSIWYFYQVRSNITHRGKGIVRDFERTRDALAELLPIFRFVLKAARKDSGA